MNTDAVFEIIVCGSASILTGAAAVLAFLSGEPRTLALFVGGCAAMFAWWAISAVLRCRLNDRRGFDVVQKREGERESPIKL